MMSEPQGWRAVATNPNATEAIEFRQQQLAAAWLPSPPDRVGFIQDRCRGRRVLDLGCAGQGTTLDDPNWLHRQVLEVASACVGADYEREEVRRLRAEGLDVVFADVSAGPGELASRDPFDVVLAGELIEHLPAPQALFEFAAAVLRPGGSLIVTTPNPFALLRVASGRRGQTRDNADHVVAAFPSGIAELADRTGFRLTEAATTDLEPRRPALWRAIKAELWHLRHPHQARPWWVVPLADVIGAWSTWDNGWLGETSLYVLEQKGL